MRKITIALTLIISSFIVHSQDSEVYLELEFGKSFPVTAKDGVIKIIGKVESGIAAIGVNMFYTKLTVYIFDKEMGMVKKGLATVDGQVLKYRDIAHLFVEDNALHFVRFTYDKQSKSRVISKFVFDERTMTFVEPEPVLAWQDGIKLPKNGYGRYFWQAYSPDSSTVAFLTLGKDTPEAGREVIVTVTDKDFNVLWEKRKLIPSANESVYKVSELKVSNNGKVYITRSRRVVNDYLERAGGQYDFNLMSYEVIVVAEDVESQVILLNNKNQTFGKMFSKMMADGTLRFIFSSRSIAEGLIYLNSVFFDEELDEIVHVQNEIVKEEYLTMFLEDYELDEIARRQKKGRYNPLRSYEVAHVVENKNSSTTLILEQRFITDQASTNPSRPERVKMYNFRNIMVVNMDEVGKINWTKVIPHMSVISAEYLVGKTDLLKLENDQFALVFKDFGNHNEKKEENTKVTDGDDSKYLVYGINEEEVFSRTILTHNEPLVLDGLNNFALGKNEYLYYEGQRLVSLFIEF
ncbi:MAG: hypothetical protein ACJAWO_001622 [Halieaceae bacterium]|jgi:hypothetical protein